jgi:peptidoglycan/xylan/chitin deacetylase (PgdA/CDA1 family)
MAEAKPLSLTELVAVQSERKLTRNAVVVTFDDGYADNLYSALPLLERSAIPATVFVATGSLGLEGGYWWDRLEQLLLLPGQLADPLSVTIGDERHEWRLDVSADLDTEGFRSIRGWNVLQRSDPSPRHRTYRALCQALRPLSADARERVLSQLLAQRKGDATNSTLPRGLSEGEVRQLAVSGLVEIGAHSVSHPVLTRLDLQGQRREIEQSKQTLEGVTRQRVASFAYPYGSETDYSEETVQLVRQAGFACACTTRPATVRHGSDPFTLPRMIVRDWGGEEFARRLRAWFLE